MAAVSDYNSALKQVRSEVKLLIGSFNDDDKRLLEKGRLNNDISKIIKSFTSACSIKNLNKSITSENKHEAFQIELDSGRSTEEKIENFVLKSLISEYNDKIFNESLSQVVQKIREIPADNSGGLNSELSRNDLAEDIKHGEARKLKGKGILNASKEQLSDPCLTLKELLNGGPVRNLQEAVRHPLSPYRGQFNKVIRDLYADPANRTTAEVLDFLVEDSAFIEVYYNSSCSVM